MGMVVRTNMMAINANRNLGKNNKGVSGSLEKLASGFRINRAGDDASGLAISEKMKAYPSKKCLWGTAKCFDHPRFMHGAGTSPSADVFAFSAAQIKKAVEANGDVLITLDPILDVDKQNEQILDLIDQRVDAIFVNPIDAKKIEIGLKAAKKAKIPVIVVDAPIYDESLVNCSIASNNYDAGVLCAKDMMSKRDHAKIILLEHATAKSAVERIQGFLDTIASNANYQVINRADCDGQIEIAMPTMKQMLKETPAVDVVMALNDRSALGALAAIESMEIDNVLVYGVDGSPDVKELINTGLIQATAAQSPVKMGQLAYQKAKALLENKKIEKKIEVPVELISRDNISNFELTGWQ